MRLEKVKKERSKKFDGAYSYTLIRSHLDKPRFVTSLKIFSIIGSILIDEMYPKSDIVPMIGKMSMYEYKKHLAFFKEYFKTNPNKKEKFDNIIGIKGYTDSVLSGSKHYSLNATVYFSSMVNGSDIKPLNEIISEYLAVDRRKRVIELNNILFDKTGKRNMMGRFSKSQPTIIVSRFYERLIIDSIYECIRNDENS